MPFNPTIQDETQHVRRWRRQVWTTAPQAHGDLCVPVSDGSADARFRDRSRRQLRACGVGLSDGGRPPRPSRALTSALSRKTPVAKPHTAIDRRALITGRVLRDDRVVNPPGGEIASILVQARPERLSGVEAAIVALAGCEIYGRDPKGKLVVVVDAPDAGALGTTLNSLALLPDVYSASLVFHAIDAS